MNANCYQIVYRNHVNPKRPYILLCHKWNRNCRPFRSTWVHPRFSLEFVLLNFSFLCSVFYIIVYHFLLHCMSFFDLRLLITPLWYMPTPNIPSPEETLHAVLKCKQKKSSNYIAIFAEGLYHMYVIKNNELKSTLHWQKIISRLSNNLMLTKDCIYIYIA